MMFVFRQFSTRYLLLAMGVCVSSVQGVTVFHLSNFEAEEVDGWSGGADPTVIATGGPGGEADGFLRLTSFGGFGPGSHAATYNPTARWTGDYAASEVYWLLADAANDVASEPLELRAVLHGSSSGGTQYSSAHSVSVPNDGVWRRIKFSLIASEMMRVRGSDTYSDVFAGIDRLMIRHAPDPQSPSGQPIAASFGLDNLRLVPNVGCEELESLITVIIAGTHETIWDLDSNDIVDHRDLNELLSIAGRIRTLSRLSILPGDANIDGLVDGTDFGVWNANKFTNSASWCAGDFNADGSVDGSDFNLWNANKFTSSDPQTVVPEPISEYEMFAIVILVAFSRLDGAWCLQNCVTGKKQVTRPT